MHKHPAATMNLFLFNTGPTAQLPDDIKYFAETEPHARFHSCCAGQLVRARLISRGRAGVAGTHFPSYDGIRPTHRRVRELENIYELDVQDRRDRPSCTYEPKETAGSMDLQPALRR